MTALFSNAYILSKVVLKDFGLLVSGDIHSKQKEDHVPSGLDNNAVGIQAQKGLH